MYHLLIKFAYDLLCDLLKQQQHYCASVFPIHVSSKNLLSIFCITKLNDYLMHNVTISTQKFRQTIIITDTHYTWNVQQYLPTVTTSMTKEV